MNNDLISRSELKKAFAAWKNMDDYYHDTDCDDIPLSEAYDLIDNAPTVDTYTKDDLTREYLKGYNDSKNMNGRSQGDWIMEENNKDYPDGRATCSHCGYKMDVKRWEWLPAVRWYFKPNYCPECGADMRKRSDE